MFIPTSEDVGRVVGVRLLRWSLHGQQIGQTIALAYMNILLRAPV